MIQCGTNSWQIFRNYWRQIFIFKEIVLFDQITIQNEIQSKFWQTIECENKAFIEGTK